MTGRVLMTGATGFLGSIIAKELLEQGYEVLTIGKHENNTFKVDLTQTDFSINCKGGIDMIVHVAGKAHSVPRTKQEEQKFFVVNFEGTKNLCNAIVKAKIKPSGFVFISTVAVYGQDRGEQIREDHPLLGDTPYAKSKIMAEHWLQEWAKTNDVKLAILRLPLVAGQNPPGNLGAMIKGIGTGKYLSIGMANAKKSVVWAEDVAKVIPVAAATGGIFNLTDGHNPSFGELEVGIAEVLDIKKPHRIPFVMARILAFGGDLVGHKAPINSTKLRKITSTLTFDDSNARNELNWHPNSVLDKLPEMI